MQKGQNANRTEWNCNQMQMRKNAKIKQNSNVTKYNLNFSALHYEKFYFSAQKLLRTRKFQKVLINYGLKWMFSISKITWLLNNDKKLSLDIGRKVTGR